MTVLESDAALRRPAATSDCEAVRALFHITGTADPSLLARVVDPVAKLGLIPSRLFASSETGDGSEMTVDLRLTGVARIEAERVALALRRIVGVSQVLAVIETAS